MSCAAAQALFGGSAERVPPGPKSVGHEQAFYGDVAVMAALPFSPLFASREKPATGTTTAEHAPVTTRLGWMLAGEAMLCL